MIHFDRTSDLLAEAGRQMLTRGQTKHQHFAPDGAVCIGGSVLAALGYNVRPEFGDTVWITGGPFNKALYALLLAMGHRGILGSPALFNDTHDYNDCLALIEEARILCKEAGD